MSFVAGTLSGALVASGVYYAVFSHDLQTRTSRHRRDLHSLLNNLCDPQVPAPPPAAFRIQSESSTKTMLKQRWNEEIEGLFVIVGNFDESLMKLRRRITGDRGSQ